MLLVFDHNWKKKEMTVKTVTSERLLLPFEQYKVIAGTSGAWLQGKVGLVWESLRGAHGRVSGPISCDSWTAEHSRAEATLMAYMSPVTSALPVSFQELEDSKWEALTAGLGGGRKGKTFFTRLSVSSRRHLTSCVHLWPCSGMHLRSEDPLWQNSSLLFWKGDGLIHF